MQTREELQQEIIRLTAELYEANQNHAALLRLTQDHEAYELGFDTIFAGEDKANPYDQYREFQKWHGLQRGKLAALALRRKLRKENNQEQFKLAAKELLKYPEEARLVWILKNCYNNTETINIPAYIPEDGEN